MSYKIDIMSKTITKDKEGHYKILKSNHQEILKNHQDDRAFGSIYAPNIRELKHTKNDNRSEGSNRQYNNKRKIQYLIFNNA